MKNKAYNQQRGESVDDWKYRIILGKARKEIKLSWSEIIKLLDLNCGVDSLRHAAYGILGYARHIKIYRDNIEMQKEKMQLQDQRRELKKLLREWARAEHIQSEIKTAIKTLKPLQIKKSNVRLLDENNKTEAVLLLSDWHYGQWTDNSCNIFNSVVFADRIEKLLSKTVEYCELNKVKTIHVMCLGDMINGLIHVTTRISNTEDVIRQTMQVAETLARVLNVLSFHADTKVYFARGNHDRVSANKKESITAESFFDFLPWYLKTRMAGVSFLEFMDNTIDSEIISAEVMGSLIYGVHGHRDKITSVIQNLSLMTKRIPDYVVMGHTHHAESNEINGSEVIVNPSLSGTDQYAYELRRASKPAQTLLIFNKTGLECTYKINL